MDVNIVLLFIMIPALVQAGIIQYIVVDNTGGNSSINLYGSGDDIISDDEIRSFGMTDTKLKDAVRVFLDKSPNDMLLLKPTPWNDLSPTYGWLKVRTKLETVKSTIKDVSSRPVVLYRQLLVNNNTIPGVYSVGDTTQTLEETVATNWSRNQEELRPLLVSTPIDYHREGHLIINVIGEVKGGKKFSSHSKWGNSEMASRTVSIGTSGVQVTANPGQAIVAELTASRVNSIIEIDYRTTVNGSVAAYFDPKYRPQNHSSSTSDQFFSLDVNDVLSSANLPQMFNSTETINATLYSDAKVTVHDHATGSVLLEVPVEIETN